MNVVVIGGGILGVSTAWNLAKLGASVTLLEAGGLAGGTSATSFAWLNSSSKTPCAYHLLNVAGMNEHLALSKDFDSTPWLHQHGNLIWDLTSSRQPSHDEPDIPARGESLVARVDRLRSWNYPVKWMNHRDIEETHRDVVLPYGVEQVAWFPSEGYCDAPSLVAHLAQQACALGADIRTNTGVVDFILERDRVSGVITSSGERIPSDVVVGCVGRWTDMLTARMGQSQSMAPTFGLLVSTSRVPTTLASLIHTPDVNLRPDGGSRLLLAAYDIDGMLSATLTTDEVRVLAETVLERARRVVPAMKWAEVVSANIGTRSIPGDGFPSVGWLPEVDGYYSVATHSGVTMGPLLGRIAATEILTRQANPLLETFRPSRFIASSNAQTVDTGL